MFPFLSRFPSLTQTPDIWVNDYTDPLYSVRYFADFTPVQAVTQLNI